MSPPKPQKPRAPPKPATSSPEPVAQTSSSAPTQSAKVKPANDRPPASANTTGKILPKTEPNPAGAAAKAKPRTKAERDRDIAHHEQERKDALKRGDKKAAEDADLKIAQVMDEPKTLGDVAGEAGGIIGTILGALGSGKGGRGGSRGTAPAKPQPSKPPAPAHPPPPSALAKPAPANGGGGLYSTGKARYPKHKCELLKYKDMLCKGEKHHVVPDYTLRTGTSKQKHEPSTRIPGTPGYDDGLVICISAEEHRGLHKTVDQKIQGAASPNGTISAGKTKEISATEAAKKSGCNPKNIKKQLDRKMKTSDDALLRGVKDSRKVTDEIRQILNGGKM
ncbi:hypothetical protein [Acidovorax sp. SUPP3334]|uniref:hypothetical protein n=1 Tax=Acidovorax sp. SUPP3334 TaxID=2920881 RepID=UPI0023DE1D6A|nr:hypothetical protein [Acidovorax sp. SUPP3334]GKT22974.1 hypothetical protein AVHM3334_10150 [Acidovorax sp. SUPP3334]